LTHLERQQELWAHLGVDHFRLEMVDSSRHWVVAVVRQREQRSVVVVVEVVEVVQAEAGQVQTLLV